MVSNVGGTVAGIGIFTGLAVALGVISATGYGGNCKNGCTTGLPASPPTIPPGTLPRSSTTSRPTSTTVKVGTMLGSSDTPTTLTTTPPMTPAVVTLQLLTTTVPSTSRPNFPKSRYSPLSDKDVLVIIASIIGALIVIAAIVAIVVYRVRESRRKRLHYGIRSSSSVSGGIFPGPPMIPENDYYSTTSSPTDIYFDAMKQIPLHRPPDAFMTYSEFGDDEFAMGGHMPYPSNTMQSAYRQYHAKQPPPMMMEPAVLEYPQPAYPGPYFINPPPNY